MRFITAYNYEVSDIRNYEIPTGISQTVPNEVLTPREMLDRYTRGLPLSTYPVEPIYSEEELPDIQRMDLDELHDYRMELKEAIKADKEQLSAIEAERKTRAEVEKYKKLAAQEQDPKPQSEAIPEA